MSFMTPPTAELVAILLNHAPQIAAVMAEIASRREWARAVADHGLGSRQAEDAHHRLRELREKAIASFGGGKW